MREITLAHRGEKGLNEQVLKSMYRLRHSVFRDRLHWDVNSNNGLEYDEFDQCNPLYLVVKDDNSHVVGSWRLLPTTGPYMLKNVFPYLLHGQPAPEHPGTWEISRFALSESKEQLGGFGFSDVPVRMIQTVVRYARQKAIEHYVAVISVAVERMLRKTGLKLHRYGPPVRIGNVTTVACWIPMDRAAENAVFGLSQLDIRGGAA